MRGPPLDGVNLVLCSLVRDQKIIWEYVEREGNPGRYASQNVNECSVN